MKTEKQAKKQLELLIKSLHKLSNDGGGLVSYDINFGIRDVTPNDPEFIEYSQWKQQKHDGNISEWIFLHDQSMKPALPLDHSFQVSIPRSFQLD